MREAAELSARRKIEQQRRGAEAHQWEDDEEAEQLTVLRGAAQVLQGAPPGMAVKHLNISDLPDGLVAEVMAERPAGGSEVSLYAASAASKGSAKGGAKKGARDEKGARDGARKARQLSAEEMRIVLEEADSSQTRKVAKQAKARAKERRAEQARVAERELGGGSTDEEGEEEEEAGKEEEEAGKAAVKGERPPSKGKKGGASPRWAWEEEDDEEEDDDEEGEDRAAAAAAAAAEEVPSAPAIDAKPPRRASRASSAGGGAPLGALVEAAEEDEEGEGAAEGGAVPGAPVEAANGEASGPISLDVLWDVDSCPLPPVLLGASVAAQVQRQRLRIQTACARGAILGAVVAYGEFGNLADSEIALALVSCNVQVVGCGAPGTCQHGGVSCSLLSAMCLRALDQTKSALPRTALPLLVISNRPEVHRAADALKARGFEVSVASADAPKGAVLATTSATTSANGGATAAAASPAASASATAGRYTWPQLYPAAAGEGAPASKGRVLSHSATHNPKPLPSWMG